MKTTEYGEQIYSQHDLFDRVMQGYDFSDIKHQVLVDQSIDIAQVSDLTNQLITYIDPGVDVAEWDRQNQCQWLMPEQYQQLDIAAWVLEQCNSDAELQRCGQELLLFQSKNLFPLLCYLKYLVDTMKQHNIIWGVGRGSSVASYVLYKIGVHRVDSLYYDLDIEEFLR